ncbi:MAG: tetratricopeptide repeat protein [Stigonema ocellatum SAG 48.90 = DSM 106950]|nr:tetratricopeptide repeat protein [Stigonema ocellatum SAG 48.90 = DSM 106950]
MSLNYGYGLVYTNLTEPGMSGGPVLDTRGRVIGIHGRAEVEEIKDKAGQTRLLTLGFSLGVPVSTFLSQAQVVGIKPELLKVETSSPPPLTEEEKNSISEVLLKVEKPSNSADAIDWANYGWQVARIDDEHKEQGIKALDRAIELKPNFYQAWYLRGFMLMSKKEYPEAIKSWDKATQIEPGFGPAWRLRGLTLVTLKRYQEALESFDRVIKLDPNDLSAQIFRSIILSGLNRFPEALDASNQVLKSNPVSWAYFARGVARIGQKDFKGALADLNEAIRRNPEYIEAGAYYFRGVLRAEQKDFKGALVDLNEAVRLEPENVDHTKFRGNVRLQLQDYKGAITDYTEAIRMKPDDADAHLNRGAIRILQKDFKGALVDLNEAIRRNPESIEASAYYLRGAIRILQKDFKGAIADYTEAIRLKPDDAKAYYLRGAVRFKQQDFKGALADVNEAVRLKPEELDYTKLRGNVRSQLQDYKGAIADYTQALGTQASSGVGIQLEVNPQTKVLTVVKVIENSPSQKGGIKVGDQVLAIDSQPTTKISSEQAIKLIRGQIGTQVTLRIARADRNTPT